MKNSFVLAVTILLSGCSVWNSWHWDWSALNPWSSDKNDVAVQELEQPQRVNKYLWQAALDKLSFMGIVSQNPQSGRIVTDWKTLSAVPNERFKAIVEIDGPDLRADALSIKMYKEIKNKNGWVKTRPSIVFENEVGQAIITRAKILYINDKKGNN